MWLLKTEPNDYSYDQLEREGRTRWDGVSNPAALKNIRAMKAGDRAFLYHTGKEKAVEVQARDFPGASRFGGARELEAEVGSGFGIYELGDDPGGVFLYGGRDEGRFVTAPEAAFFGDDLHRLEGEVLADVGVEAAAERALADNDLPRAIAALAGVRGPGAAWAKLAKTRVAADRAMAGLRLRAIEALGRPGEKAR